MTEITAAELHRLELPLSSPYHLSHTTVSSLDTILIRIETSHNGVGWGEVTTLRGYSAETISESQSRLSELLTNAPGQSITQLRTRAETQLDAVPFTQAGVQTALVAATREGYPAVRAPVVGIVSASQPAEEVKEAAKSQYERGYETIKLKIGFDPVTDATVANCLATALPQPHVLRADANQAYSWSEAVTFAEHLDAESLQLIEQPFETGQLQQHAAYRSEIDFELMLDEEIETKADIRRVVKTDAADLVKLKLMKQGGPTATAEIATQAMDNDLDVVLGNGVQSDIGCLVEADLWKQLGLTRAGEFNGWSKQVHSLLSPPLKADDGTLAFDGGALSLDAELLDEFTTQRLTYSL
jgi:o-succinylbenzoate synthase